MFSSAFFANNLANLDTLNDPWFPLLAIVFVSASTMAWASERANGPELLFTLPGSDLDLRRQVLGGGLRLPDLAAVPLVMPLALFMLGNPDLGRLAANYLGYWLFGIMLVAISLVGSQLTQNGTVAGSSRSCSAPRSSTSARSPAGSASNWETTARRQFACSRAARYRSPAALPGRTVSFFYLGLALSGDVTGETGRWACTAARASRASGDRGHGHRRAVAAAGGLDRRGSTARRRDRVAAVDPGEAVYITAYVSEQVPETFVQQKKLLLNLLDQFD